MKVKKRGSLTQRVIWQQVLKSIDFREKSYLELGAGTGIFGKYALEAGAKRVSLLDFSDNALRISKELFKPTDPVDFIHADLLRYTSNSKYDIVLSNGLIEHFKDPGEFKQVLAKHFELSCNQIVLLAPASPHFNDIRVRYSWAVKKYGWQRPLSKKLLRKALNDFKWRSLKLMKFYPLYGIKLNQILPFQSSLFGYVDSILDICRVYHIMTFTTNIFGSIFGGYLIVDVKVND